MSNYRSISLLCAISKVLERLVHDKLFEFIHSSVPLFQFGLKSHSSLQQLLVFVNNIFNSFSDNCLVDSLYLDFRKAFDKVSHNHLLSKLSRLAYVEISLSGFTTTCQTGSSLFQSMVLIHQFCKSLLLFHRVAFWVLCFSWLTSIISQILSLHVILFFLLMILNVVSLSRPRPHEKFCLLCTQNPCCTQSESESCDPVKIKPKGMQLLSGYICKFSLLHTNK